MSVMSHPQVLCGLHEILDTTKTNLTGFYAKKAYLLDLWRN